MKTSFWLLLALVGLVSFYSCTKDHTSVPVAPSTCTASMVYNVRVKNILDTYCLQPNLASCHDAATGIGADYGPVFLYDSAHSVYAFQLQTALQCIENQGRYLMPPIAYYPSIPDSLRMVPPDSITVLQCWAESNGYK